MAKRPKRYGGTATEREQEEQRGRHEGPARQGRGRAGHDQGEIGGSSGGGRASEADNWEREESFDDEDLDALDDLSDDDPDTVDQDRDRR